jgi:hypothetical protein
MKGRDERTTAGLSERLQVPSFIVAIPEMRGSPATAPIDVWWCPPRDRVYPAWISRQLAWSIACSC